MIKYLFKSLISPQVHIPPRRHPKTFVFEMRCEVTSSKASNVLLSRELIVPTYKHVCRGEKKKVNLGYNNDPNVLKVEKNTLISYPEKRKLKDEESQISRDWEVLSTFFNIHQILPTWLNCGHSWGHFDVEEGQWTGCMGKVRIIYNDY